MRSTLQESAKNTIREDVKIAVNATEDAEEHTSCGLGMSSREGGG